ncbi:hypothetical protein BDW59DRAFT_163014 [Aspergillus cavernicola]|uniref:Uncharacterized protein n=1 Tax=Aspergillus cavernicola TaxID=176166 RepID=A0ABR4I7B3_9EURO
MSGLSSNKGLLKPPQQELCNLPESLADASSLTESARSTSQGPLVILVSSCDNCDSEPRRLPMLMAACIKCGMSACEIGQYLHRVVTCSDNQGTNMVREMIADRRPYHEIGREVLKRLDLKGESQLPMDETVHSGDESSTPQSSPDESLFTSSFSNSSSSTDKDEGKQIPLHAPKLIHPANQVRRPFLDMIDDEIESLLDFGEEEEEEEDVIVHQSSPPRSVHGEICYE